MLSAIKNKTNKLIHWICVPSIFFSILGLLAAIPTDFLNLNGTMQNYIHFGSLAVLLGLGFYIRYSISMTIGILSFSMLCLYFISLMKASSLPLAQISLIIFIVAWIGQFIGHKIEGEKPSFLDDLKFLLIGPAWLISFIYQRLGIRY